MTCDRERCWRDADVFIPALGAWCSTHALAELGTWPTRHFREIETRNKDSHRKLLSGSAV